MTGRWREGARNVAGRSKEGVREMVAGKRQERGQEGEGAGKRQKGGRKEAGIWQERDK